MEGRFAGKVAVVTGATQGMGQAISVRLASEGALVCVNRRPDLSAEDTLAKVKAAGGEAFDVAADMREPEQVNTLLDGLDWFVRVAGICGRTALHPRAPVGEARVLGVGNGSLSRPPRACRLHRRAGAPGRSVAARSGG